MSKKEKNPNLRKPKGKRGSKALLIVLIILLVLAIAAIVTYAVFDQMSKTAPSVDTSVPWSQNTNTDTDPQNIKRYEDYYNFLVVGKDNVALNTDVMMLINLNLNEGGSMTIMQLPRDTLVNYNGQVCKLNSMYSRFYNASDKKKDSDRINEAMQGLTGFLAESLAIKIDYYANLNLDAFGKVVDAIGGVDMYVPYRMQYEDTNQVPPLHIDLYEGQQTLDGDKAQQFVRFRNSYVSGDLGRTDAQKLFMTAFIESFKNKITVAKLPSVVSTILGNLTHSVPLDDATYFARQALEMDFSNMTMLTAPNTEINYYGSYVVLHRAAMYKIINENFNMYSSSIPEESFDINKLFTVTNNYSINSIYMTTQEFDGEYSVDEIQDNGIDVPRAW
ncbi:MAG: LCP family protein [Clostridia bacterium]|nr:LCP family protein [Clostridia bacterium]